MRLLLALLTIWTATALAGAAQGVGAARDAVEAVALVPGWRTADGSRLAAVEIRLAPGWHTYWRAPGSAGIPPAFDWTRSGNLASAATEWPRPQLFSNFGATSIGYARTVLLPVRLVPADPSAPLDLELRLDFGVCADICVPAEARLAATIAPDAPEEGRARIEAALAARAESAAEAGVARVTCALEPHGRGYAVTAEITFAAEPPPGQVAVLEPQRPDVWIGDAVSRTEGRTVFARAPIRAAGGAGPVLERRALRLTVLDDRRAVDIRGCEAPG
jgi:DsbC/DsbD-like thiol-disulfide interchange protein